VARWQNFKELFLALCLLLAIKQSLDSQTDPSADLDIDGIAHRSMGRPYKQ